jgi:hypothetical protein
MKKDKKNKIFFVMFFALVLASIVVTFYRYVIKEDFVVFTSEEDIPELLDFKDLSL